MIKKIISGGQTGVGQGALDAAIQLGIPHGGWISKGRLTEDGLLPDKYQLHEMPTDSYAEKVEQNVIESDGTLILSHGPLTDGLDLALELTKKHNKSVIHIYLNKVFIIQAAQIINEWMNEFLIEILNVTGSQASKDPQIYHLTMEIIKTLYYLNMKKAGTGSLINIQKYPKTIKEAVNRLVSELPLEDRVHIANLNEDDLDNLNFALNLHIRNEFGLWANNGHLMEACKKIANSNNLHIKTASLIIIEALWKELKKTHRIRIVI